MKISASRSSLNREGEVAEWLRRRPAKPMGTARVSSSLILIEGSAFHIMPALFVPISRLLNFHHR